MVATARACGEIYHLYPLRPPGALLLSGMTNFGLTEHQPIVLALDS